MHYRSNTYSDAIELNDFLVLTLNGTAQIIINQLRDLTLKYQKNLRRNKGRR